MFAHALNANFVCADGCAQKYFFFSQQDFVATREYQTGTVLSLRPNRGKSGDGPIRARAIDISFSGGAVSLARTYLRDFFTVRASRGDAPALARDAHLQKRPRRQKAHHLVNNYSSMRLRLLCIVCIVVGTLALVAAGATM